jgi:trimethylamine--corrinoid protein Co-methyltransferase
VTENSYDPALIRPITPKHLWHVLGDDELQKLEDATYTILREVGIHFPLRRALDLFAEHGAAVDFENKVVRLEPDLVKTALSQAPRYFAVGGREPEYNFHLQKRHTFYATDGCMPFTVDFETREKRQSRKDDVAQMARMADYFKTIAFYWPMVSAADYGETAPLHEIHASYLNCRKHVQTETAMGHSIARYAREMATVISGGGDTLRANPPLSVLICCIDPLGQDKEGLETAFVFAEAGLPVGFMAMNTLMTTGPATPAGALAVGNAEVISALTMVQLAFPGAPVFHAMPLAVMEPLTAGYMFHSPLGDAMFGAAIELAHHFNVPTLGSFGGSDATEPGWRSAKEGMAGLFSALAGSEMVVGVGGMAAASVLYPENLVLDSDLLHDFWVTTNGIEVTAETLALDMVKRVGPRGNYLMERHTLKHMRQIPFSDLILETTKKGRTGALAEIETARQEAQRILNTHTPNPLEKSKMAELDKIIASADRELKGA